jgi:hypothetical protein
MTRNDNRDARPEIRPSFEQIAESLTHMLDAQGLVRYDNDDDRSSISDGWHTVDVKRPTHSHDIPRSTTTTITIHDEMKRSAAMNHMYPMTPTNGNGIGQHTSLVTTDDTKSQDESTNTGVDDDIKRNVNDNGTRDVNGTLTAAPTFTMVMPPSRHVSGHIALVPPGTPSSVISTDNQLLSSGNGGTISQRTMSDTLLSSHATSSHRATPINISTGSGSSPSSLHIMSTSRVPSRHISNDSARSSDRTIHHGTPLTQTSSPGATPHKWKMSDFIAEQHSVS